MSRREGPAVGMRRRTVMHLMMMIIMRVFMIMPIMMVLLRTMVVMKMSKMVMT